MWPTIDSISSFVAAPPKGIDIMTAGRMALSTVVERRP